MNFKNKALVSTLFVACIVVIFGCVRHTELIPPVKQEETTEKEAIVSCKSDIQINTSFVQNNGDVLVRDENLVIWEALPENSSSPSMKSESVQIPKQDTEVLGARKQRGEKKENTNSEEQPEPVASTITEDPQIPELTPEEMAALLALMEEENNEELVTEILENEEEAEVVANPVPPEDQPKLTKRGGTFQGPSGKETYYNLPMGGVIKIMRDLGYSEEEYPYWVREDGCKMLGNYIIVAANLELRPRGTIVETSRGFGIVADTGSFAKKDKTGLDLAVSWGD